MLFAVCDSFHVFWWWQVSWPLDLIANTEALKKYNKVIALTLKYSFRSLILVVEWREYLTGRHVHDGFGHLLDQVMGFLLKVKRAKFVLDETRKWMWKVSWHQIILCYLFFVIPVVYSVG